MTEVQSRRVVARVAEEFFKIPNNSFAKKLPTLQKNMTRLGFTKSQATAVAESLFQLSFNELKAFLIHADKMSEVLESIKLKSVKKFKPKTGILSKIKNYFMGPNIEDIEANLG
jgi:hypothetical protein